MIVMKFLSKITITLRGHIQHEEENRKMKEKRGEKRKRKRGK
jgi:hypothetical protein